LERSRGLQTNRRSGTSRAEESGGRRSVV